MDAERARAYLMKLPHVCETVQWGGTLVLWAGDKAIGGKMLALVDLEGQFGVVMSFAANPERSAELKEREGLIPAPYLARAGWIGAERWSALRESEWHDVLREAHTHVLSRLPKRTLAVLALPKQEQQTLIAERRRMLQSQEPKPRVKRSLKPA